MPSYRVRKRILKRCYDETPARFRAQEGNRRYRVAVIKSLSDKQAIPNPYVAGDSPL